MAMQQQEEEGMLLNSQPQSYGAVAEEEGGASSNASLVSSRRRLVAAGVGATLLLALLSVSLLAKKRATSSELFSTATSRTITYDAPLEEQAVEATCTGCSTSTGATCMPCVADGHCSDRRLPAIFGYDPISFRDGYGTCGVMGNSSLSLVHEGYEWWFVSEANRKKFASNPNQFSPAFGGYCAFGIATEGTWSATVMGPPVAIFTQNCAESFHVDETDGRLYFFNGGAINMFLADKSHYITEGNLRWDEWFNSTMSITPPPVNTDSYAIDKGSCVDTQVDFCCSCAPEMDYDCGLGLGPGDSHIR